MEILFGVWLWLAIMIVIGTVIAAVLHDNGMGASGAAVVGLGIIWFLTGAHNPFPWIAAHYEYIIAALALYFVGGVLWGIAKWWFFLHNAADDYERRRSTIQSIWDGFDDARKGSYPDYKTFVAKNYNFPPKVSDHKDDILFWMCWWPFSATVTLLNDPVRWLFRVVYQEIAAVLGTMSAKVFGNRFTELK